MSETKEPIFKIPLYYDSNGETLEGSALIFDDYLEIRKIIKPNRKIAWEDVISAKATYSKIESYITKEHNGWATAANLINSLVYTLDGTSIGYAYQGNTEMIPYIADYSEKIIISTSESGKNNNYTFSCHMKDSIGDLQFTRKILERIKMVDEFNRISANIIDENKKNSFDKWYSENVKTDFGNKKNKK